MADRAARSRSSPTCTDPLQLNTNRHTRSDLRIDVWSYRCFKWMFLPLTEAECQPPADTAVIWTPQSASTTRASSCDVRWPLPSCPWLPTKRRVICCTKTRSRGERGSFSIACYIRWPPRSPGKDTSRCSEHHSVFRAQRQADGAQFSAQRTEERGSGHHVPAWHQRQCNIMTCDRTSSSSSLYKNRVSCCQWCVLPLESSCSLLQTSRFCACCISQHSTPCVKLTVRYLSLIEASVQPSLSGTHTCPEEPRTNPDTHTRLPPETQTTIIIIIVLNCTQMVNNDT